MEAAHAATWAGSASGDWATGSNWSGGSGPGGVPGNSDTVVINSGPSNGPVVTSNVGTISETQVGIDSTGGALSIQTGGSLSDTNAYVGTFSGTTSSATVSGIGASWTNSGNFIVGNDGQGVLVISGGGGVTSGVSEIGNYGSGTGSATVTGAGSTWSAGNFYIGNGGAGGNSLTVENGGSVIATTGNVFVAGGSSGSLLLSTGGKVNDTNGFVGGYGGVGTATITGAGSLWANSSELYVANGSTGSLTITDHGSATAYSLIVAFGGNGAMTIESGATASDVIGIIGAQNGTSGNVTVSGAGAAWTNSAYFVVGGSGQGTLAIDTGGKVTVSSTSVIGQATGVTGSVSVTGPGTNWTTAGGLTIASSGQGTLSISNQGSVTSGGVVSIAENAGSTGTLNIGSAQGFAPVEAGSLNAQNVVFGAGTGVINFNHTGTYVFSPGITGDGTINALSGNTLLAGNVSGFDGTINLSQGANISTIGQQQDGMQTLVSHQQAAMIVNRSLTNQLLGFTRPTDQNDYVYAGAMFGSAEGMAGGQYANKGFTLLGGLAYGKMDDPSIRQTNATTVAAAVRYTFDNLSQENSPTLKPYIELGGSVTPNDGLTFARTYMANFNKSSFTSEGSTNGTMWSEFGRAGLIWTINSDNRVTGYGEYGQQDLSYDSFAERTGPFPTTFGTSVMRMEVARLGASYTLDLRHILYAPFSVTFAGAAAHAVNAQAHLNASIQGSPLSTGNSDPTWGEFGVKLNVGLTDQLALSLGADGTTGVDEIRTTIHGDIGMAYTF